MILRLSILHFNKATVFWQLRYEFVGENYNAEVGYVPNAARRGYQMAVPNVGYLFSSTHKNLSATSHCSKVPFWNKSSYLTDNETFLAYNFNFRNRAVGMIWAATNYVQTLRPLRSYQHGVVKNGGLRLITIGNLGVRSLLPVLVHALPTPLVLAMVVFMPTEPVSI